MMKKKKKLKNELFYQLYKVAFFYIDNFVFLIFLNQIKQKTTEKSDQILLDRDIEVSEQLY